MEASFQEKYHWEWHRGKLALLNAVFKNDIPPERRGSVLDKLDINPGQREFLLKTLNVDWLMVKDRRPVLIEEKSVGIQRIKKLKGNSLLLSCGYASQPQTLQRASELGIEAGVLVKFVVWGTLGPTIEGTVRRNMGYDDGTKILFNKIYHWGESAFPSDDRIMLVDDFSNLAKQF